MSDSKQETKGRNEGATAKAEISRSPWPEHAQVDSETLSIIEVIQEVKIGQNENAANFCNQQNALLADGGHQSIENTIKIIKERCEALQRIADRPSLETADGTYGHVQSQLQTLLKAYRRRLAHVLLGKCCFHILRSEYMELYYYATELQSVATKLSDSGSVREAQCLLSKKFVLANWDISNLRVKARLCQISANILRDNLEFMDTLAGNELDMVEYQLLRALFDEHITRCDFQLTLDLANRLLEIACKVQNREMIITMLANFGNLYLVLGEYQLSYDIMQKMLHWEINDLSTKAILFCNFSVVELLLDLKIDSLQHAWDAFDLALQTEDQGYIACGHGNIGLALEYMGMYDEAIEHYEGCLQVGVDAGNSRVINNGLCNLGRAYQGLGDIDKAKAYFRKAVDTPRPPKAYWCDTQEFRFSGDYLLAKLAVKEKNWEEARKQLMAVIKRCETLRKSIQDSPIKITFNDTQRKPFQLLQHVMLEEGKEMEALAVAEKGRGRDFFDKTEGDFCTQLDSVDVLLNAIKSRSIAVLFISALEEVGKLCLWFISSEGKLLKQCLIPSTECKNLFTLLRGALYRTQGRHEIEFKGTTNGECSIINKAIELVKQLDSTRTNDDNSEKPQNSDNSEKAGKNDDNSEKPQNNYDDSEKAGKNDDNSEKPQNNDDNSEKAGKNDDNSEKTQNNDDNSKRSRHSDDNLEKNQKSNKIVDKSVDETGDEGASYSTNESRKQGSASQSQPPSQEPSSETTYSLSELIDQLSELILVPLKDELESLINKSPADETSRLLIIPQGTTFNIPFSALKLNSKRLCEQLTIIEAFSLHSFAYSTTESEKNVEPRDFSNALIVGNPTNRDNLPQAEVEAKRIAKILDATPLIGREATKKAVMERLPNAPLVHFACHGELEGKALVLAQSCPTSSTDCCLTPEDVASMKLDADLVVLSACHTARGEINSEGVVGFARAFQIAGARSVVTALWAIPDHATERFMELFYDNLRRGHPVADAIRETQVAMMKSQDFCELINWGSFKVFGANARVM